MVVDGIMLDKASGTGKQTGQCSDCGCSFSPPQPDSETPSSALPRQRRVHKTERPSKCPSCVARHALSNGPRPHQHIRPDPHSCTLCSKTFISPAHLALHLASHGKDKRLRCGICNKYFAQASGLIAHKLVHSGDRPYKCPECGKAFSRISNMKIHHRRHTGEKPFKCTYCDKAFSQKAGLFSHVRLHTRDWPYKCEKCGETFRSLSHLQTHKAQKASEQHPEGLKCGVCCRTFMRSSYVRLCLHLNKGQRPYHCNVCNMTFVKLDTFVSHCNKHLRQKKVKREVKERVVKPPMFVPLSRPPSTLASPTLPVLPKVNTRSRAKAKSKKKA